MLTFTQFSGSPFQIGLSLGKFGAPAVHDYLTSSPSWESAMQWRGTTLSLAMQEQVKQRHPYIWDELQGLAKGLALPAEDVFLWNSQGDLGIEAFDSSTTVMQLTDAGPRITHNEDGDPKLADQCGIAEFAVDQGPAFAGFVYPGLLPGHSFAVTENGLAVTVNSLRTRTEAPGLPRAILAREVLNRPDLAGVVELLQESPRTGGFHLAVAQKGGSTLLSIECCAAGVSVQAIRQARLHANHLVHDGLEESPQCISDSSRYRQIDGTALLNRQDAPDALAILADQSNAAFPLLQTSADAADAGNTLATADIHVGGGQIDWNIYEHPDEPPRFTMLDARHI